MKEYIIKQEHFKHYIVVKVYKTKSSMRSGITRYGKEHDNCCGMFSPTPVIIIGENREYYNSNNIGTLFLNEECLGVGVVSHECLHAAISHERKINKFDMCYGDGFESLEDEERLAYLLTFYCKNVYDILYKNKHIKEKL